MWTTVREKVRQRSRTTEVMLAGAIVRAVEGDTLVLSHESAPLAKRLSEQRNADVIREALKDALGVDWKIRCEAGAASAPAPPADDAPVHRGAAKRDEEEESMLAEAGQRHLRGAAPRPRGSRARATAERTRRASYRRQLALSQRASLPRCFPVAQDHQRKHQRGQRGDEPDHHGCSDPRPQSANAQPVVKTEARINARKC